MYYVEDENFARQLQTELQAYENFKRQKENKEKENLNPVDAKLEYIDPTPSIHDLFVRFDKKFFWNTLGMVQVLWSNKMTKCAGMCSFEGGRGLCKISLSAPLLSLRPRKDLVETLLHEMIHAYLFVTHNYKDREDHGPEFHKHMYRINKEAGTKITVYHTFHDEVEYYQRHIWRCNGPCQKKKPYFGFVRRAINRAPGPYDTWWSQHQSECGGTFIKISEPEGKSQKTKKTKVVRPVGDGKNKDIRDFFSKNTSATGAKSGGNQSSNIRTLSDLKNNKPIGGLKTNAGTGTIVVTNNSKGKISKTKSPKSPNLAKEAGKLKNKSPGAKEIKNPRTSSTLSSVIESKASESIKKDSNSDNVRETVRNIWANKFLNNKPPEKTVPDKQDLPKKTKLECPICAEGFPEGKIQNHVETCLGNTRTSESHEKNSSSGRFNPERLNEKRSTSESSRCETSKGKNLPSGSAGCEKSNVKDLPSESSSCEKTDEMKQCPVCSENFLESEMNDHLENCLSCSFQNENDGDFEDEIVCESVPCPCCYKWFKESEMNVHIDECLTLRTLKEEILVC